MSETENDSQVMEARIREKRYQWTINVLLVLLGFFTGVFFEAERIKAQVVTNTVEIRVIKDSLDDITAKLSYLIDHHPGPGGL